jgi:hypothetical protein
MVLHTANLKTILMKKKGTTKKKQPMPLPGFNHNWRQRLLSKLVKLEFPPLTQKHLMKRGYATGRRIFLLLNGQSKDAREKLISSPMAQSCADELMRAVWRFDREFLIDFAEALKEPKDGYGAINAQLYRFMLDNCKHIEKLGKKEEIIDFITSDTHFCEYDKSTLGKLCTQIGLPICQG